MLISDLFKNEGCFLSFEVFPPKSSTSFESVKGATEQIAALNPSFVSVTYGAGGGTSKYTIDIAENIGKKYNLPTLAHLTCVSSSHESIKNHIEKLKAAGIENVMALRGDMPKDGFSGKEEYHHAIELVRELKQSGGFCIGGACYPEVHPESVDSKQDIAFLKEKVDAGCDFLTTQMFFDNNLLYSFLYKIREAGITVPIIPGIMPITNANQLERAITLSGSFIPQRFKSLVDRFKNNPAAMKQAGIAYATDQIIDLYANGIKNVHVYSMNKPDVASAIKSNLSDIITEL